MRYSLIVALAGSSLDIIVDGVVVGVVHGRVVRIVENILLRARCSVSELGCRNTKQVARDHGEQGADSVCTAAQARSDVFDGVVEEDQKNCNN